MDLIRITTLFWEIKRFCRMTMPLVIFGHNSQESSDYKCTYCSDYFVLATWVGVFDFLTICFFPPSLNSTFLIASATVTAAVSILSSTFFFLYKAPNYLIVQFVKNIDFAPHPLLLVQSSQLLVQSLFNLIKVRFCPPPPSSWTNLLFFWVTATHRGRGWKVQGSPRLWPFSLYWSRVGVQAWESLILKHHFRKALHLYREYMCKKKKYQRGRLV